MSRHTTSKDDSNRVQMLGYARTSTDEQIAGLDAQIAAIRAAAAARPDWNLVDIVTEHASGGRTDRDGLNHVLERIRSGEIGGIIVAKFDRLTRCVAQADTLLDEARENKWVLVALDVNVDLSTPAGEMMANIVAAIAKWERRTIGQRTTDALAVLKAQGVRLGRPRECPDEILVRVLGLRAGGSTLQAICNELNAEQIPTPRGGRRWYPSYVHGLLKTQDALALAAT